MEAAGKRWMQVHPRHTAPRVTRMRGATPTRVAAYYITFLKAPRAVMFAEMRAFSREKKTLVAGVCKWWRVGE